MKIEKIEYVSDELSGPFNTFTSDDIPDLHKKYKDYYDNESESLKEEYEELKWSLQDEMIWENEEYIKVSEEGTVEEHELKHDELYELYIQKYEEAEKELELKLEQLEYRQREEYYYVIFEEVIRKFMYHQGYKDLEFSDIEYLMKVWENSFVIEN